MELGGYLPRWWLRGTAAVGTSIVAVMLLVGCTSGERGDGTSGPDVDLPAIWRALGRPSSWIALRADGTGTVRDFPIPARGTCSGEDSGRYSGEVEWEPRDRESATVLFKAGGVLVWADADFGSLDWSEVAVGLCGSRTPLDDWITYSGGSIQPDWKEDWNDWMQEGAGQLAFDDRLRSSCGSETHRSAGGRENPAGPISERTSARYAHG